MKKLVTFASIAALTVTTTYAITIVDFDTASKWTAGSGIISYQTDHQYNDLEWNFSGGPALRETATLEDGVAGALGTNAWRLKQVESSSDSTAWFATFSGTASFTKLGFDVRR